MARTAARNQLLFRFSLLLLASPLLMLTYVLFIVSQPTIPQFTVPFSQQSPSRFTVHGSQRTTSLSSTVSPKLAKFLAEAKQRYVNDKELATFDDTIRDFVELWSTRLGRTYLLYGGTLLGAFRHHGPVPYDDDMDLLVPAKYRESFRSAFVNSTLSVVRYTQFNYKVFLRDRKRTRETGMAWRWPFLDIFFLHWSADGKRVLEPSPGGLTAARDLVFPAISLPYRTMTLTVPRCPESVLRKTWDIDECCTGWRNHKFERNRPIVCVPCAALRDVYSFVLYRRLDNLTVVASERRSDGGKRAPRLLHLPLC